MHEQNSGLLENTKHLYPDEFQYPTWPSSSCQFQISHKSMLFWASLNTVCNLAMVQKTLSGTKLSLKTGKSLHFSYLQLFHLGIGFYFFFWSRGTRVMCSRSAGSRGKNQWRKIWNKAKQFQNFTESLCLNSLHGKSKN